MDDREAIERFRAVAGGCSRCAVLTGAGISAESGVPTFRGADGLWQGHRPEDLATPEAFARDPDRVLGWYDWRRGLLESVAPNPGHHALAAAAARFQTFTLITQNVDGLHELAGSRDVVELHGNIRRDRCHRCGARRAEGIEGRSCACGGRFRPDVVWFGEMLPAEAIARAFEAARTCDLFLTVGTSALVYPAAWLPQAAAEVGAFVVEVNTADTAFTPRADLVFRGPAGEWLPRLFDEGEGMAPPRTTDMEEGAGA